MLERNGYEYWLLYDWSGCDDCEDFGSAEVPFVLSSDSDYDYEDFSEYGLTVDYYPDEDISDL